MKSFYFLTLFLTLFTMSCSEQDLENIDAIPNDLKSENKNQLRSAFNGYFEWDRVNQLETYSPYKKEDIIIPLPWQGGSAESLGIPDHWIDDNATSSKYNERKYARENGWVLVYSNLHNTSLNKYFALYNKYTGLMRFFLYTITSSPSKGTTQSFWGINIITNGNATSLLNHVGSGSVSTLDKKQLNPYYISSTEGILSNGEFGSSIGYKTGQWYGFEFECSYDPSQSFDQPQYFQLKGWATNKMKITGAINTKGTIKGEIRSTGSGGDFNLSLSNMFNNSVSNSISVTHNTMAETVGEKIDSKKGKDNFFKTLWGNVTKNAGGWIGSALKDGAKQGISAILSGGGSTIGNLAQSFVSSLIGGGKESVSKVDLELLANSKVDLEGTTVIDGWGTITKLPIPGTTNIDGNKPLYNNPLGVWSLKEEPICNLFMRGVKAWKNFSHIASKSYIVESYILDKYSTSLIELNPSIKDEFTIQNLNIDLVLDRTRMHTIYSSAELNNPALFNNREVYLVRSFVPRVRYGLHEPSLSSITIIGLDARLSFELKHKKSGEVYTFMKYITAKIKPTSMGYTNEYLDRLPFLGYPRDFRPYINFTLDPW